MNYFSVWKNIKIIFLKQFKNNANKFALDSIRDRNLANPFSVLEICNNPYEIFFF